MASSASAYPYLAKSVKKYRSPHAEDLSFAKGALIRVLSVAPRSSQGQGGDDDDEDDDEDDDVWLVGELKNGTAKGTFPGNCIVAASEEEGLQEPAAAVSTSSEAPPADLPESKSTEEKEVAASANEEQAAPKPEIRATEPQADLESKAPQAVSAESNAAAVPAEAAKSESATAMQESAKEIPQKEEKAERANPPPPKPKPSGLAARIAAFNQAQQPSAPPSLPKGGKPAGGGWKRPQPKEAEASSPAAASPTPISTDGPVNNATSSGRTNEGFSAADAASSIKMSLKERMAALQRGGAGGGGSGDGGDPTSARSPPPVAAKPRKLTADQTAAAISGFGGPAQPKEATTTQEAPERSKSATEEGPKEEIISSQPTAGADEAGMPAESKDEADSQVDMDQETKEPLEVSEEEQEAQRRAALAQRMAKLGGQRFGGPGPAMFGAPRAAPPKKEGSLDSVSKEADTAKAPESESLLTESEEGKQGADVTRGVEEPKPTTLNVPRRTAPPRRKRSAAPASPKGEEPGATQDTADPAASDQVTDVGNQVPTLEPSQLPDEDPATEPELVSGPPDPENVADPGKTAESLQAEEKADSIEKAGEEAEEEVERQHRETDEGQAESDEALQRQTAELNRFLQDPSQNDGARAANTASGQDSDGEEMNDAQGDSTGEDNSVPPALLQQLGLTPTMEREDVLDDQSRGNDETTEDADIPSDEQEMPDSELDVEDDQIAIGQDLNAARTGDPPPEDRGNGNDLVAAGSLPTKSPMSPPPRPTSAAQRPPIPGSAAQPQRAIPTPPPARTAPTPPVPSSDALGRRSSSVRPPVPKSPPPPPQSAGISATMSGSQGLQNDIEEPAPAKEEHVSGPPLAAPKARHAVPVEDDDEEEQGGTEYERAQADAQAAVADEQSQEADDTVVPESQTDAPEQHEDEPGQELTPEQEEAARRAAIAKRMAALGGQRMGGLPPMMGMPAAPPRRQQTAESERSNAEKKESTGAAIVESASPATDGGARRQPPQEGVTTPGIVPSQRLDENTDEDEQQFDDQEQPEASQEEVSAPLTPPDNTKSPPPPPIAGAPRPPMSPPPRPPSTVSSSSAAGGADNTGSKRLSVRPPVPAGAPPPMPPRAAGRQRSIDATLVGDSGDAEEAEAAAFGSQRRSSMSPPLPPQSPSRSAARPSAPSSPAPPPPPPQGRATSLNRHSRNISGSSANTRGDDNRGEAGESRFSAQPASARDLNLEPASRWWRHDPVQLPRSITGRPDAIIAVDSNSSGPGQVVARVLFVDYSMTTVFASWNAEDEEDESQTRLEQRHDFPPAKPSADELKNWSGSTGVEVAKEALLLASKKGSSLPQPSLAGTPSYALTSQLVQSTRGALAPVNSSFGATVWSQVGSTVLERNDEVRIGDVVELAGADFKGKKGLGGYHVTYGASAPTGQSTVATSIFGVVVENESKKNRLRIITAPSGSGGKGSAGAGAVAVEEVTLKLDDLKAGLFKVMRVPPRGRWVESF